MPWQSQLSGSWKSHYISHWGRVTYICVSKLAIFGSDNGLSPGRHQTIIWTNAGIGPLRTNFSEMLIEIHTFSFKENAPENVVWKMAAILSRPQCVKFPATIRAIIANDIFTELFSSIPIPVNSFIVKMTQVRIRLATRDFYPLNQSEPRYWLPVAYFTKEVNTGLARQPLKFNGGLANLGLISLVK